MTSKILNISEDLAVPLDAVTSTFCVVGIRGSGKSNTAVVMAEEMLKAKQQIIALDPKDDWHGMRSSADGLSEGLPITILGGSHQDAPLEYTAGALVAQLAIEERISLIIATKHLSDGHRFKFTFDFCDYLYKHCREPMHLFLDEADQFAPQEKQTRIRAGENVSEAMMLNLVRRVIKQGRTSGLGISLITQSPATLDKRVMNMCETLVAMRVIGAQDFDAVQNWFKVYVRTKGDLEDLVSRLPKLKAGEGIFYSPAWLEVAKTVRFRMAETFDSRKTPKVGETRVEPKVLAPVDLEQLSQRMKATIEKVKAEDPKELRRINAGLQAQIAELERQASLKPLTVKAIEKPILKIVEKPIIKDPQIARLEKISAALGKRLDAVAQPLATMREFKISLDGLIDRVRNLNGDDTGHLSTEIRMADSDVFRDNLPENAVKTLKVDLDKKMDLLPHAWHESQAASNDEEYDMADFEEFYRRTVQRLQQDGFAVTVKVEPKEFVLKEFQQEQITRILAATTELSSWQKSVIRFMEAKGTRAIKKDIFTAIIGKEPAGGSGQTDRYKAIDELVTAGILRNEASFMYPNLTAWVGGQLRHYNATDEEIQQVIDQVLLQLK